MTMPSVPTQPTETPTRMFAGRRGLLLATVLFANFVFWLDVAKFGLLNPFWSKDLGLTPAQISSASASYLLGYFPLLLLAGIIADRIGPKILLVIGIAGVTVLSASMAFVHTYDELYWRNLVFGIFFGLSWAPAQRLLAMWFPGKDLVRATSTWMSSTLAAGVLAPAIALPIANHLSWQDAFLVVAALGIPAFFMLIFFVANKPEGLRGMPADEAAGIHALYLAEEQRSIKVRLTFREVLQSLRSRSILTMIIATGLATSPTWLQGPWGPYGLITLAKVNPDTIAWVTPLLALVPVLYGLVHGSIVKRTFGGRTRPWLGMGPLCGAIGFFFAFFFPNSPWVFWAFMVIAFAYLCDPMFWGTINSYWSRIARPEVTGTLNGIAAALQVAVGYFIVDQSGKWVTSAPDRSALSTVWLVGAVIFLSTLIFVFLSKEVRISRLLEDEHEVGAQSGLSASRLTTAPSQTTE